MDREKLTSSSSQILWVGKKHWPAGIERPEQWRFRYPASTEQAKFILKNEVVAVIVVHDDIGDKEACELLSYCKGYSAATTRIAVTNSRAANYLQKLVNEGGAYRIFDGSIPTDKMIEALAGAISSFQKLHSQQRVLTDITFQNRKLEELTQNLEFLVEERARSVESSRDEASGKLKSLRKLIAFVKNLSLATIVDDWLSIVGNETKIFHGIGFPILAFTPPTGVPRVITFRGKDLMEIETAKLWPHVPEQRTGYKGDQIFLANLFGRPVANVLSVPLAKGEGSPVLYFEYTFSSQQLTTFQQFFSTRLQPIVLSLDRILFEQHTRYASKQWELTFDSLLDPVAIIDIDYYLLRSNKSFYQDKNKGYCYKFFASRDSKCDGCPVASAMESGKPQVGKIRANNKIFEVYSFPVQVTSGLSSTNVINYYRDITNERKLFSRLVQNEKLTAIGSLAGNIAHELNNPLTGIRALAQYLEKVATDLKNDSLLADLKEIESAAERSQKTIKNLLDFSQPSNATEIISLNEVVSRTLPMLKAALRDFNNHIELTEESITVKVDVPLLQQVIFNIILNSCQSMKQSGQLSIRTSRQGNICEILIEDTGHGIASENLHQIFEPFYTTKKPGQGTGLGLSMSKAIVEKLGGTITVDSSVGVGTKMYVRLPFIED